MLQEERQRRSKQEILHAALAEFGSHEYGEVNMENICKRHGISKGMMYHYYSNKDELFLLCVEDTFTALKASVEEGIQGIKKQDVVETIRSFFMLREYYLDANPERIRIFECAMLRPPEHLREEIRKLWEPLHQLNKSFIHSVISSMPLREGMDDEKVMRYLDSIEPVLRTILVRYAGMEKIQDVHKLFEVSGEVLDMLLSGVMKQ